MHSTCEQEMSLIIQLSKIQFQLMHQFLASIDMYPGQFHVLNILAKHKEGLHQKEIGKKLYIKPSSVNQIIVKLEDSGYIERITEPLDKRMVIVTISKKGLNLLKEGKEKASHIEDLMKEGIPQEDLIHFEKVAQAMKENLLRERNGEHITCH